MGIAAHLPLMTARDFLAWEALQSHRHEFVDGAVYAMAGAEDRHVTTAGNIYVALRGHLRGTPYRAFMSDMKLYVAASNIYFYPDVMVTCSAGDHASRLVKSEPQLVVEVLSPGTVGYDRGEKFAHYRRLASLKEYVLIDLDTRRTDVYRKGAGDLWVLHPFEAGQSVELASVAMSISAADLFAEVDPPA